MLNLQILFVWNYPNSQQYYFDKNIHYSNPPNAFICLAVHSEEEDKTGMISVEEEQGWQSI